MLYEAIRFARECHSGQIRKYTLAPYITHPVRVMGQTLLLANCTQEMAVAAVLHDVVEDCGVLIEEVAQAYGATVAGLVAELTEPPRQPGLNRAQRKALTLKKLAAASAEGRQIKMIDRMDNLGEMPLIDESIGALELYLTESEALLEVIGGADGELAGRLRTVIDAKKNAVAKWKVENIS